MSHLSVISSTAQTLNREMQIAEIRFAFRTCKNLSNTGEKYNKNTSRARETCKPCNEMGEKKKKKVHYRRVRGLAGRARSAAAAPGLPARVGGTRNARRDRHSRFGAAQQRIAVAARVRVSKIYAVFFSHDFPVC